jgi:CBS domain containing-hemolysin-like protein
VTFALLALGVVLIALSIGLAAVEAAFYLIKRRRLTHLALENPRAEMVNRYLEDPPLLLMPVHMGTYTAHVAMTVVILALLLEHPHIWTLAAGFGFMVLYLLLFRLTLPYSLVRRSPERSLLLLLPVFNAYARALQPLVSALRRQRGGAEGGEDSPLAPVPEFPAPPVHEEDEGRLLASVARFATTQVREVMTPRPDVVALPAAATLEKLQATMRETKYSRIIVYGENLDDIQGAVMVRDFIEHDGPLSDPVQTLLRPVHLVPETKKIAELLKEFQAGRFTFAVVVDEYGGTAGLVTVEDIVEELVGELKDEYDVEAEPISVEADGAVLVAGRVNVDRLEQALEAPLADGGVGTVGGLVSSAFGRVPKVGERIDYKGFTVEVVDAERKRVNRVRFRRKPAEAQA